MTFTDKPSAGKRPISRRRFLRSSAVGLVTFPWVIAACSDTEGVTEPGVDLPASTNGAETVGTRADSTVTSASTAETAAAPTTVQAVDALTVTDFEPVDACAPIPGQAEGPYYLAEELLRSDIIEDRSGTPLRLGVRVVDHDCSPVRGAAVDIWHSDSFGDYSAFVDGSVERGEAGPGTTFLRGSQVTDADGIVEFTTIWPGWYPGRTVHIHLKVRAGASSFTTQMYFDDAATTVVYESEPYSFRGPRTVFNGSDRIAGNPDELGLIIATAAAPTGAGQGYLGLFVASVDL